MVLFSEIPPITEAIERQIFQENRLIIDGRKIMNIAMIAYFPRKFFVTTIQLFTVKNATETVLPIIGTVLPIINFAVFDKAPSVEEEISVPSPITAEKTVIKRPNIHTAKFFTDLDISPIFISEIDPAIVKAKKIQIKGAINSDEICEIKVTVASISE